MAAAFFRGTQADQNVKFKDKDKQLIKETVWPAEFEERIDLTKVQVDVIKNWMERRIPELMGMEDEVVAVYAEAQLEECANNIDQPFCPKKMQIYMTGFMGDAVKPFMLELQRLLLAAQVDPTGIPPQLVKAKFTEKEEKLQAIEEAKKKIALLKQLQSGMKAGAPAVGDANGDRKASSPAAQGERSPRDRKSPRDERVRKGRSPSDDERPSRSQRPETRKRYSSRSVSGSDDSRHRRRKSSKRRHRSSHRQRSRRYSSDRDDSHSDDSRRKSKKHHRSSRREDRHRSDRHRGDRHRDDRQRDDRRRDDRDRHRDDRDKKRSHRHERRRRSPSSEKSQHSVRQQQRKDSDDEKRSTGGKH